MVGAVLLLIALLNFVNWMVTKTVSRRKEFAVYQSLGMTLGQLRRLVLLVLRVSRVLPVRLLRLPSMKRLVTG